MTRAVVACERLQVWTHDLGDGTSVMFRGAAHEVAQVLHARNVRGPPASFDTLGAIYPMSCR